MTSEEATKIIFNQWQAFLEDNIDYGGISEAYKMAMKALDQQLSEDCISRSYIESIVEELENICINGDEHILSLLSRIKNASSVTPQQISWIPVTERLPEEFICDDGYVEPSDYVLVWGDHGNYGVSRYWGNRKSKTENPNSYKDWMDLDWIMQKPIAWMPLPEPYKEESKIIQSLAYADQDTLMPAT